MKLVYESNRHAAEIREEVLAQDIEFTISILAEPYFHSMKQIEESFQQNDVITDVMIFTYANHEYRAAVRKEYYHDFLLQLLKYGLLAKLEWKEE